MIWLYSLLPFIIIGVGALLLFIITGSFVFHTTMNRHKKCEKYDLKELFENGEELSEQLFSYENHGFKIVTTHNKRIVAKYFLSDKPNGKLIILVHGIYCNMYQHAPHALEYLKRGYDVFMYNQRGNGGSSGHCNTYGYYERYDLQSIAKYIRKNLSDKTIIVHGFSMGAATAAMQSEINENGGVVSGYILECPYSSLPEELMYVAKRGRANKPKKHKLPYKLLLKIGNIFTRIFLRFSYKDVIPKDAVKNCSMPMLVIAVKGDVTCPYIMAEELFDCKVQGTRDILTLEGSTHIRAYYDYPERYLDKISSFIDSYC